MLSPRPSIGLSLITRSEHSYRVMEAGNTVIGEEPDLCPEKDMLGERHKKFAKTVFTYLVRARSQSIRRGAPVVLNRLKTKQVVQVYYVVPGENDGANWTFLIKHKNGNFVFFDAGCDYTGFDCQGGGGITYVFKKDFSFFKENLTGTVVMDRQCGR